MSQTIQSESTPPTPLYLSVPAFARWVMISTQDVQCGIDQGDIPARRHRGQWWIDVGALVRQLRAM